MEMTSKQIIEKVKKFLRRMWMLERSERWTLL